MGFNQGILEEVDLWPKLSKLEVSGEKHWPHSQALPNVSLLGVLLQAMISWVGSGNEARKAYVPSLHCVGSASVGFSGCVCCCRTLNRILQQSFPIR